MIRILRKKTYDLLRWSEKYAKTDMVYVVKGGSWLSFGQIVSVLLAFISSLFFANVIPKEIYGNYKYIIAATGILSSLSLTGLGPVIVQAVARGAEAVFKDAIRTSLRWGSIILAAAILAGFYYFLNDNFTLGFSLLIGGGAMFLINSYSLYGNYLVGKKDFKSNTIYTVISQIGITAAVIITAVTTKNVLAIVAAYFLTNVIFTLFFYKLTISKSTINDTEDTSMMSYSKHLSLMNFFGALASQADKILLFHYLGATQLAVYAFAQAIPEQIRGVFKSIFGIALPKYASLSEEDMLMSIRKKFGQLTLLSVIFIILYIFTAPYIFKLLFPKYIEAVLYSQIYVLGLITIPGISLFATYFQLKKATRVLYKLNIISNVFTLVITFSLIYKYGLLGAVVANGLSWFLMLIIYWHSFERDKYRINTPMSSNSS